MELVMMLAVGYIAIGLLFGLFFAFKGAGTLDPVAQDASLGFRFILVPGAAALWPVLALKLARHKESAA